MKITSNIFFLILLSLSACSLYNNASSPTNFASAYKKDVTAIHPQFIIFHESDSVSELHFSIHSRELLYTKQANETLFSARVKISYRLLTSFESQQIIDSSSVTLLDQNNDPLNKIVDKIPIHVKYGNTGLLEISVFDLKRGQSTKTYLNFDKKNEKGRPNFLIKEENKKTPVFKYYFTENEKINIMYKNPIERLFVRYYKRDFPMAAPPFIASSNKPFNYTADSTYIIALKNSTSVLTQLPKQGLYHFQTDTSQSEGLTLYVYSIGFPEISSSEELASPLRYITTNEEFEKINKDKNKKQVTDNFWITISGSKERGRELISKFYNRVQDANIFFTSYLEGWKTDRGMIYIIYGPPGTIHKTSISESWVYGEESNMMSFTFNFIKVINPFTDDDYVLERSPVYKTSWYRAVDAWRQGRVY